jgi:hypothetical protein
MPSQTDLDMGGTVREWVNQYLGPSVGWVQLPARNILEIIAPGTYTLDLSTNLVHINVNGLVTIIMPPVINPSVPAGVLPGKFGKVAVGIVDIGGFASGANPITIQRNNANENILGLASIQITAQFGGFILYPSNTLKGWTNQA